MTRLRIVLLPMACLTLSACNQYTNQYIERKDTITFSAGDAVATNSAVTIPTPWPRYSNDTNLVTDGEKMRRAIKRYREGDSGQQSTEFASGSANQSAGGNGGASGPPPGQGGPPPGQGGAPGSGY